MTLLRCVGWLPRDDLGCCLGHAGPGLSTPGAQCSGVHTFDYSLIPFSGSPKTAIREAHAFRAPLRAIAVPPGDGALSASQGCFTLTPAELVVSAIKPTEDSDGLIVRFWSLDDGPVSARLAVGFDLTSAEEVNLLEERLRQMNVIGARTIELTVRGKQIVSIRLQPA